MNTNIAILILAAGSSSRMGTPKQLLTWGKSTLIENAIEQAVQVSESDVFVVIGANYKLIFDAIERYPITILKNPYWEKGIGSSISCGIKSIQKIQKYKGVLIMLADQPFVDVITIQKIKDQFVSSKSKIVASQFKDSFGVPAVFSISCFDLLTSLKGDEGAKKIWTQNKMEVESCIINKYFNDIDTPKDYKECLNLHP